MPRWRLICQKVPESAIDRTAEVPSHWSLVTCRPSAGGGKQDDPAGTREAPHAPIPSSVGNDNRKFAENSE